MLISIYNMNDQCTPAGVHTKALLFDPCEGCELRDFCDADDCAKKLYEIDSPEPPRGTFEDWITDGND